jgi:hypothetical protein
MREVSNLALARQMQMILTMTQKIKMMRQIQ